MKGVVTEIYSSNWSGLQENVALVETNDAKGSVLVNLHYESVNVGDEVSVSLKTGGASGKFLYARIEMSRKEILADNGG